MLQRETQCHAHNQHATRARAHIIAASHSHAEQVAAWRQRPIRFDEVCHNGTEDCLTTAVCLICLELLHLIGRSAASWTLLRTQSVFAQIVVAVPQASKPCPRSAWDTGHAQPVADIAESASAGQHEHTHAHTHAQSQSIGILPTPPPSAPPPRHGWRLFGLGAVFAIVLQFVVGWLSVSPVWERFFGRFVWNRGEREAPAPDPPAFQANSESTALVLYSDSAESVEWVNMCWRKVKYTQYCSEA